METKIPALGTLEYRKNAIAEAIKRNDEQWLNLVLKDDTKENSFVPSFKRK